MPSWLPGRATEVFGAVPVIVIPGLMNKLGAFSVRFAPRVVVRKLVKILQGVVFLTRL